MKSADRLKINLFVIGASKCGTTFLHDLLGQCPDICMSSIKEPFLFFAEDFAVARAEPEKLYQHCGSERWRGESSPIYSETTVFPEIPQRIYQYNPDSRIIYLVREPFARLRSVYAQTLASGHWAEVKWYKRKMPLAYPRAVFEYPPFLEATRYWTHLQAYRNWFPDRQIKVVLFEELARDSLATLTDICLFLSTPMPNCLDFQQANRNSSTDKTIYNPWPKRIRQALPLPVQRRFPRAARVVSQFLGSWLPRPQVPQVVLSRSEEARVREMLTPEVAALYEYLGVRADPWQFFSGERS